MSAEEGLRELGAAAREARREVDTWWEAAERGDASILPGGSPPIEALCPIDAAERERISEDVLRLVSAPTPFVRRSRSWIAGAMAMAIAATVAAIALRAPPEPVSVYTLIARGGDRTWRSSEDEQGSDLPRYRIGSRLEIVLQPEVAPETAPEVSVELVGARTMAWPAPIERGRAGTFRLVGELGTDLLLEPGAWSLVVVVGRSLSSDQRLVYRFEVVDG